MLNLRSMVHDVSVTMPELRGGAWEGVRERVRGRVNARAGRGCVGGGALEGAWEGHCPDKLVCNPLYVILHHYTVFEAHRIPHLQLE